MCPSSTSNSDAGPGRPADDGLVPVSDDAVATPREKKRGLFVVIVFFTITIGTALLDAVWPVPRVQLLGRERVAAARMRADARVADGSFARLVEYEIRLRSRVRELVNPPYALASLALLGQAKSIVVVGKNSRLFYRPRVEPLPEIDPARVERSAASFAAISRRFTAFEKRFLFALVPRKCIVARAHLPRWVEPRPEFDDILLAALHARGVECPDLLPGILAVGADSGWEQLGTHWRDAAQLQAAETLLSAAGLLAPEDSRITEVRSAGVRPERASDLIPMLGLEPTSRTLAFFGNPMWERWDVVFRGSERRARRGVVDEGGDAIIYGTSFTAHSRFPHYLAHFLQQSIRNKAKGAEHSLALMSESLANEEIDTLPDLVIFELPIAMVYGIDDGLGVASTLDALQASATTRICDIALDDGERDLTLDVGWSSLLEIPAGKLVRPDDGTIAIHLRRTTCESDLVVCAGRRDRSGYAFTWPGDETEITIPIVGIPEDRPVPISIRRRGSGTSVSTTLESVELVHDLDPSMRPVAITSTDATNVPATPDQEPIELPRHATLVIERTPDESAGAAADVGSMLEITLHFDDDNPADTTRSTAPLTRPILGRLPAFVSLAEYAGRNLASITVRTVANDSAPNLDSTWTAHVATPRR